MLEKLSKLRNKSYFVASGTNLIGYFVSKEKEEKSQMMVEELWIKIAIAEHLLMSSNDGALLI